MPETDGCSKHYPEAGETGAVLVYATFPTAEAAKSAGRDLVGKRLAACVNIIPGMTAIYEWEGALHEDCEAIAIVKTRRALVPQVFTAVCGVHPYANPALLVVDVIAGTAPYLTWVEQQTQVNPPVA